MNNNFLLNIFNNCLKIFIVVILLFVQNCVYAIDIDELYDKVETENGTFYKRKEMDKTNVYYSYSKSTQPDEEDITQLSDENIEEMKEIVNKKMNEYMKRFTLEDCPEEKRIEEKFYIEGPTLYFDKDDGTAYNMGDDIVALVCVNAYPIKSDSSYWKENIPSYCQYFDESLNKYRVYIYYFIRLSKNLETGEYEISYIDLKPEGYDEYVNNLKEQGIDIENLDLEKIFKISYKDEITPVSVNNDEKIEYDNSEADKIINNMTVIIRTVSVLILLIIILLFAIVKLKHKIKKNKKNKKNKVDS